jgi:hypothetical protein
MFTADNTEGFTAAELVILNDALKILIARNPDAQEYSLSDAINNAWVGGETADKLANSTGF